MPAHERLFTGPPAKLHRSRAASPLAKIG